MMARTKGSIYKKKEETTHVVARKSTADKFKKAIIGKSTQVDAVTDALETNIKKWENK